MSLFSGYTEAAAGSGAAEPVAYVRQLPGAGTASLLALRDL